MPASSHCEAGLKAHAAGQHEKAVVHFTQGLKALTPGHVDRIKLLDHRISALLKLKKREEALNDAKLMIREARSDGRGYWRCGQLESLAQNQEAALKWYEHGVKNVAHTDKLYTTLTTKCTKIRALVQQLVVLSNPRDPMALLPLEIVDFIVKLLEFRTLITLTRVSKAWRNVLCKLPPLNDTIDFSGASRSITYQQFRASLRRLSKNPRQAVICSFSHPASHLLAEYADRWFQKDCLGRLEVDDRQFPLNICTNTRLSVLKLGPQTAISLQGVSQVLRKCSRLTVACFENVIRLASGSGDLSLEPVFPLSRMSDWAQDFVQHHLKELTIRCNTGRGGHTREFRAEISTPIFSAFRSLETLSCSGIELYSGAKFAPVSLPSGNYSEPEFASLPLKQLELSESLIDIKAFPPTISALNLSGSTLWDFVKADAVAFANLEHLNLYRTYNAVALLGKMKNPSALRALHIDLKAHEWSAEGQREIPQLENLKHLRIRSQELEDKHVHTFFAKFPRLETLRLEVAKISGVFLATLLRDLAAKLTYIFLEDCMNVSHDAVEFARTSGVTVEVKNTMYGGGGRRIVHAR
jgi:F-box/TPR repeat protein Pof3